MNVIVVDTSFWISYFKGEPSEASVELDSALREGRVYLSPVVAAELLSARLKPAERASLQDFLSELPLCESGFEHWSQVGELRARLSKRGLHASTPDAHVAQCAMDLRGYLLTEDAVFRKIAADTPLKLLS